MAAANRPITVLAIASPTLDSGIKALIHILREAKPGGFQTGGFPTFFGKDYVADPFRTVPRRCS